MKKIASFGENFSNGWLFPRYIGVVYIEPVMRQAREYARGIMLDVGCGNRRYEAIYSDSVDAYIGLDWPEFEDRAKPDVFGDAMHIPFQSQSIDTILAAELMEHLPDPEGFLKDVSRVLKPGGAFILTVPFMEPLHEEPRDYYRFTPYSLNLLLEDNGFLIKEFWKKGGWFSVVLGSFLNQVIYNWSTPLRGDGYRRYSPLTFLVLPLCALLQWLGYVLDKVFKSSAYTLGYSVIALRTGSN